MKVRLFSLLMLLVPLPFIAAPFAHADMISVHRRVGVEVAQENEQRRLLLEKLHRMRHEQARSTVPSSDIRPLPIPIAATEVMPSRSSGYVGFLIFVAAAVAVLALMSAITKNTPNKRRPQMNDTLSTATDTAQESFQPASTNYGSFDKGLEKWRDAALFFAISASSCFVFSKLGFKAVSLCAPLGSALARSNFDAFWIVRVLAALFVGSLAVYLFQRLAKDVERDLKNSLAGNLALAFVCLALLVSHAEGLYIVSVTPCVDRGGGPTF